MELWTRELFPHLDRERELGAWWALNEALTKNPHYVGGFLLEVDVERMERGGFLRAPAPFSGAEGEIETSPFRISHEPYSREGRVTAGSISVRGRIAQNPRPSCDSPGSPPL